MNHLSGPSPNLISAFCTDRRSGHTEPSVGVWTHGKKTLLRGAQISYLQTQGRGLRRSQPCWYLGLGLLAARTVSQLYFCYLKIPCLWFFVTETPANHYKETRSFSFLLIRFILHCSVLIVYPSRCPNFLQIPLLFIFSNYLSWYFCICFYRRRNYYRWWVG